MTDDRDVVLKAMHGDHEAFGELVRRHQTGVYNTAYRISGNRQDAEDATQETFIRAFRSFGSFDPSRPPGPWFRKIAVNVCLNHLDKNLTIPFEDEQGVIPSPTSAPDLPAPESQTIARERSSKILSALINLPRRYRVVIELRHFMDLSYSEIADTLKCPLTDVKSNLFRARRMLAKKLEELS